MARRTWKLRERGEALYASGADWGAEIIEACDSADQWEDADAALVSIGEKLDLANAITAPYDEIVEALSVFLVDYEAIKNAASNAAKAAQAAADAKDAEIDRLRSAMQRAGVAPPPPVDAVAFRSTPVAKRPPPAKRWDDDLEDDVPF